jgi:hypothetical protein
LRIGLSIPTIAISAPFFLSSISSNKFTIMTPGETHPFCPHLRERARFNLEGLVGGYARSGRVMGRRRSQLALEKE